jgi:2-keto-4-pentenoate hydratase/2-oxohepta-3-ene-1,7-dioic acid hydratase in catechol pathway
MKLMSFRRPDGMPSWGIAKDEGVIDLGHLAPSLKHALWAMTSLAEEAARSPDHRLADVRFLPPIPDPDKIFCVGLNYMTHIKEGGRDTPKKPTIFSRTPSSQVGHLESVIRPKASETFDYEGEMAVVIGRRCRHVPRAEAKDVIAGYSCYNEGSVREFQRHSTQFIPGKNFWHAGAFGPWIVTPEEVGDISRQTLMTRLNGEEVQHATIDDLLFDVPALIEYCSTFTELLPGDVIVTGTTGGVGAYRKPPLWMKPGDTVEVEVSGVGLLRNSVAAEE